MVDGPSALDRLCEPASEVSCHYVVDEDGTVTQLVPEALRAHHAGRSFWAGESDLNSASIGIEIVNGGHDFGLPPFPEAQIASVIALCRDVAGRYAVSPQRILAHSDIAPSRKQDPGERFPWQVLAEAGIGLWVSPGEGFVEALAPGNSGDAVAALQDGLALYGLRDRSEPSLRRGDHDSRASLPAPISTSARGWHRGPGDDGHFTPVARRTSLTTSKTRSSMRSDGSGSSSSKSEVHSTTAFRADRRR